MFFSVVTPTYNREKLISRVYDSLTKQTFKDFEWIVIDDGSSDNTKELIKKYKENSDFNIKYIYIPNGGKVRAINQSYEHCSGLFHLVFDSDDWCDSNALEILYLEWNKLTEKEKNKYAAISCLKRDIAGNCIGQSYEKIDKYGMTYIDRLNLNIKGDKWECLLLELASQLKYPINELDKYMAPDYIWLKLAEKGYKTIFINKSLSTIEYQEDGISKNNLKNRVGSTLTTYQYYCEVSKIKGLKFSYQVRMKINSRRFKLHCKSKNSVISLVNPFFYAGLLMYLNDKTKGN